MIYNVFGGMLSLTQSIIRKVCSQSYALTFLVSCIYNHLCRFDGFEAGPKMPFRFQQVFSNENAVFREAGFYFGMGTVV